MRYLFAGLLIFLLADIAAAAQPIERLFFTPEQRAALDGARRAPVANVGQTQLEQAPDITLSGIVTRSDGKRTRWVNGQVEHGVGTTREASPPATDWVRLSGGGESVRLKVGQTLDPASGMVREAYRRPKPTPATEKATAPEPRKSARKADAKPAETEDQASDGADHGGSAGR